MCLILTTNLSSSHFSIDAPLCHTMLGKLSRSNSREVAEQESKKSYSNADGEKMGSGASSMIWPFTKSKSNNTTKVFGQGEMTNKTKVKKLLRRLELNPSPFLWEKV